MLTDELVKAMFEQDAHKLSINNFRKKHGLEEGNEDSIAVSIHLMNQYRVDEQTALDQSSRESGDNGVDGWYFSENNGVLTIYQSKLSPNRSYVLQGFSDLQRAKLWLEYVLLKGEVNELPSNNALYNLFELLAQKGALIKKIDFILLSPIDENRLLDSKEYDACKRDLIDSDLNKKIKVDLKLGNYNFDDTSLPTTIKTYQVTRIINSTIKLGSTSSLDLAYVPLQDLVQLHRRRGSVLFEKNIRLSISNTKEARDRLVHPMEETLNGICEGKIDPNIFTFYHIGVTLAADRNISENKELLLDLDDPSIVNGCQTITIADAFLKKLEAEKNTKKLELFKEIKVIAKIVIGVNDEELRQITNANNRQNPIDNWQLFSNDPIHIDIEDALQFVGVFYERQKGKFNTVMKKTAVIKNYPNTNKTFISIPDLGQIICLSRANLKWAAKPSDIFINKKNHDSVFDRDIQTYVRDMILISNAVRAMKRALINDLDNLALSTTEVTTKIFSTPFVKTYAYYLALMYFYQTKNLAELREGYSSTLNKVAPKTLVEVFEDFLNRVITKTRRWYITESKNFETEVANKKFEEYIKVISLELGIDLGGPTPFTKKAINWE